MDRIFVTGDCHGVLSRIYNWVERFDMNKDNVHIIIAGDAGICWRKDKKDMIAAIKKQEQYNFHLWFIDGNHENFDILKEFSPINSSGIANLGNNLHYITRGTKLTIMTKNGIKTILFCGGADSIDKALRTPHTDWWADEAITQEDVDKCLEHKKDIKKVDYIITHCCPYSVFNKYIVYLITLTGVDQRTVDHTSELMLDKLAMNIDCNKHFFGHYHVDKQLDDKYTCLLNDFIEL